MKKSMIYSAWAVLYILCAAFGFVSNPTLFQKSLLIATCILFFIPPFFLLFQARKEKDRKTIKCLRLISICVLSLSLILIVLNFLSVYFSAYTGLFLYVLLVLFSVPMICGQYWVLSLFLWACLLMICLRKINPTENSPAQR